MGVPNGVFTQSQLPNVSLNLTQMANLTNCPFNASLSTCGEVKKSLIYWLFARKFQ